MIIVYHQKNKVTSIYDIENKKELVIPNSFIIKSLFFLSKKFDTRFIVWCNNDLKEHLNLNSLALIFQHKLIMTSYNVQDEIFNTRVGYIENSVFLKVPKNVEFSTWQMSCDVGGIHSEALKQFEYLSNFKGSFKLFLNYVAKQGILNGLICSSNPNLLKNTERLQISISKKISNSQLFKFVKDNYKSIWLHLLLFQLLVYEHKFLFCSYIKALLSSKMKNSSINFSKIEIISAKKNIEKKDFSLDVIIPTLGRKKYLKDVLLDLNKQTILPNKVIIIEQHPDKKAKSELEYLNDEWNFKIDHTFTHQLGACNARNIALSKVNSDFIFFADDDIRFDKDLIEKSLLKLNTYKCDAIVMACLRLNEKLICKSTTLADTFGSGTSIVKSEFAKNCKFKKEHELGFGEDADYGMQLRNLGVQILYIPQITMLHLKAPVGGFRFTPNFPWESDNPKPSPTVMAYQLKHLTKQQFRGYKTMLFLKFYKKQTIKNPFSYFISMNKRWNLSKYWAFKLMSNEL